jgi:hypothetical protein
MQIHIFGTMLDRSSAFSVNGNGGVYKNGVAHDVRKKIELATTHRRETISSTARCASSRQYRHSFAIARAVTLEDWVGCGICLDYGDFLPT